MADRFAGDPRRKAYVEARTKGLSRKESAIAAGYSTADPDKSGRNVERGELVAQELREIRAQMAVDAGVTRDDIVRGLVDAADMAKTLADPQGMVAAWRELGKLLGHYAPEVRKVEKGINKADLKKALEDLSDEELLQLSRGRVIEGHATRVPDEKSTSNLPAVQAE